MSLKTELEKKANKAGTYTKESVKKDIANKEREISQGKQQLESLKKEVEWTAKEKELFKKISDAMLADYGKIDSAKEHLWENNPEYWQLMKSKQEIDNARTLEKYEGQAKLVEMKIEQTKNMIDDLELAKKMAEEELEDFDDEDENE